MHIITIFSTSTLLFFSVCLSAIPPNWLGTFNIDDSCNQNKCCLSEQATIRDTQLLATADER
jgi:hypothetical protein